MFDTAQRDRLTLKARVSRVREATGFSIDNLARAIGASRSSIASWLSDQSNTRPSSKFDERMHLLDSFVRSRWNGVELHDVRESALVSKPAREYLACMFAAVLDVQDPQGQPGRLPTIDQLARHIQRSKLSTESTRAQRQAQKGVLRHASLVSAQSRYRRLKQTNAHRRLSLLVPGVMVQVLQERAQGAQQSVSRHLDQLLSQRLRETGFL